MATLYVREAMTTGTLYLIPTPLGDAPLDLTLPIGVRQIAARLEMFIVEHPKTARTVLKQYGTEHPLQQIQMQVLNKDTPAKELEGLLQPLLAGKDVGLMSEAGCPAVADPGANLVHLAHEKHIRVRPLVGPSAILLAVMASGMSGQRFAFHGYLPVEKTERARKIRSLEIESQNRRETEVFIETPYRNNQMLAELANSCQPDTLIGVACDLTLESEYIRVQPAAAWKKTPPELDRRPAIFLLYHPGKPAKR